VAKAYAVVVEACSHFETPSRREFMVLKTKLSELTLACNPGTIELCFRLRRIDFSSGP
jgi:hypothetical protein